jgi:hypothetical protein
MAKPCPNCRLINPRSAQRCDCGYDFALNRMERSYLRAVDARRPKWEAARFLALMSFNALACIAPTLIWLPGGASDSSTFPYLLSPVAALLFWTGPAASVVVIGSFLVLFTVFSVLACRSVVGLVVMPVALFVMGMMQTIWLSGTAAALSGIGH